MSRSKPSLSKQTAGRSNIASELAMLSSALSDAFGDLSQHVFTLRKAQGALPRPDKTDIASLHEAAKSDLSTFISGAGQLLDSSVQKAAEPSLRRWHQVLEGLDALSTVGMPIIGKAQSLRNMTSVSMSRMVSTMQFRDEIEQRVSHCIDLAEMVATMPDSEPSVLKCLLHAQVTAIGHSLNEISDDLSRATASIGKAVAPFLKLRPGRDNSADIPWPGRVQILSGTSLDKSVSSMCAEPANDSQPFDLGSKSPTVSELCDLEIALQKQISELFNELEEVFSGFSATVEVMDESLHSCASVSTLLQSHANACDRLAKVLPITIDYEDPPLAGEEIDAVTELYTTQIEREIHRATLFRCIDATQNRDDLSQSG